METDKIRVKHRPSLGKTGIHSHLTPEAEGHDRHPFAFDIAGVQIKVPNPVTWTVMKLVAMRDRLRDQQGDQAQKHAQDVCRIAAMTTRAESDAAADVISAIASSEPYQDARHIARNDFLADNGRGIQIAARYWQAEQLDDIRKLLAQWF